MVNLIGKAHQSFKETQELACPEVGWNREYTRPYAAFYVAWRRVFVFFNKIRTKENVHRGVLKWKRN